MCWSVNSVGLLTCWDKICGQLTRVKHLKTGQFLSELSVPLIMHSESQARDRGRKRPRPQETGKVSDSLCYGVLQALTLAYRNGKRPGGVRQKVIAGVEDSSWIKRSRGAEQSYN